MKLLGGVSEGEIPLAVVQYLRAVCEVTAGGGAAGVIPIPLRIAGTPACLPKSWCSGMLSGQKGQRRQTEYLIH